MKFNFTFMRCMAVLLACFTAFSLQAQSNATVTVTAPASVAGDYAARQAVFGPGLTADISGLVVEGVDTAGLTTVCDTVANDLTGSIALVDRGACGFVDKVTNAQTKGAIAVIVCNNNATVPNQAIVMGPNDPGNLTTIPAVMLSYNQCQTIRAELGNGLAVNLTASVLVPAGPGEVCDQATVITAAGTYSASPNSGYGGIFSGSSNAAWYSYTPTENTLITVTSCATTTEDTRVIVVNNCTDFGVLAFNDDCDPDNGNFASETSWLGLPGTEYLILWDDRWSDVPFDWDLVLAPPPAVDVTVSVDMNAETDNGAHIAGSFNGWASVPMTANGDGTYTYTITGVTAGDSIEYKFQNGENINWEEFAQGESCTVTDPSGAFTNRLLVPGISNSELTLVCFNLCIACPPDICNNPESIICDGFEVYPVGSTTGGSAPWWGTWGGAVGGADDGIVSDDFAFTGDNSMLIAEAQVQDVIMFLGNQTEGVFSMRWQTYIPAGKTGYFNIQEDETPGVAWNLDVFYNADAGAPGTGTINQTGTTFTYPEDAWFEVRMVADLDSDLIHIFMDGAFVETTAFTGSLGSINFFSIDDDNRYYIDDVIYDQLPSCTPEALICDNIETYEDGSRIGGQGPWWATWGGAVGGADDGLVSSEQAATGANSMLIAEGQTQDVIMLLGNKTAGQYYLSWKTYIPTGATGYYNIQEDETPGVAWNLDVFYNEDGGAAGTGSVSQSGNTFSYPEDAWFTVEHWLDLDANTLTLIIDGTEVETSDFTGSLGSINFFSIDATNRYYIDDVLFEDLTPVSYDVTFNVNMANEAVDAAGAHIAGEFNGWSSVPMTDNGDGTYSFTTQLLAGDSVEYKFQNGENINWEEFAEGEECTITDPSGAFTNRLLVVGDMSMDLDLVCFNSCADCVVGAEDIVFQNSIEVYPNPTSDLTNIIFDFAEANDITIELVNKLGQRINYIELDNIQNASHEISVNNLAAGMYFIHISNGEASMVEKLFVE